MVKMFQNLFTGSVVSLVKNNAAATHQTKPSMNIYKFNRLDAVNKVDALIYYSVLIDKRTDAKYRVLLYQLDAFYVEVYYDIEYNKISKIKSFTSTALLKPYLAKIDISSLFVMK